MPSFYQIDHQYQLKSDDDKVIASCFDSKRKRRCILLHPLNHLTESISYYYINFHKINFDKKRLISIIKHANWVFSSAGRAPV